MFGEKAALSEDITFLHIVYYFLMAILLLLQGHELTRLDYIHRFIGFLLSYYVLVQMNGHLHNQIFHFVSLLLVQFFEHIYFLYGILEDLSLSDVSLIHDRMICLFV